MTTQFRNATVGSAVDLFEEGLLTLAQATKLKKLPCRRAGKRTHISTLIRWATVGIKGVNLETLRVGSTLCTSEAALLRFFERLSDPTVGQDQRTPTQQRRAVEAATREVEAARI